MPEILHSDNGTEFLGKCISLIKKYYKTIRIVKGRPYHPQSQGSVERGNGPFKEALYKWIADPENEKEHWAKVGIYVVNAKINGRQSRFKNKKSPYEIYLWKNKCTII